MSFAFPTLAQLFNSTYFCQEIVQLLARNSHITNCSTPCFTFVKKYSIFGPIVQLLARNSHKLFNSAVHFCQEILDLPITITISSNASIVQLIDSAQEILTLPLYHHHHQPCLIQLFNSLIQLTFVKKFPLNQLRSPSSAMPNPIV